MKNTRLTTVRLEESSDIMRLRDVTSALTNVLNFKTFEKTRTVTAVVELGRNAIEHADRGRASFSITNLNGRPALGVTVVDQGRGIPEDKLQVSNGAVVSSGLGLGLRGVQRIAQRFEIETGTEGTRIETTFVASENMALTENLAMIATDAIAALNATDPATTLAEQNRQLMESIADQDLLMKELHHRTGNNLALIVALIRLSKNDADLDETKQVLSDLETRVASLTKAHELMQQAANAGTVNGEDLLREVARNAEEAFYRHDCRVKISVSSEVSYLDGRLGVDLGLIVGELITNAYKYAFAGRETGHITVSLKPNSPDEIELVVADDGIGLPAGVEKPERSNSLGWRLVRTLTFNHNGVLDVESNGGLTVRIRLSPQAIKPLAS